MQGGGNVTAKPEVAQHKKTMHFYDNKGWAARARSVKRKLRKRMLPLLESLYPRGSRVGNDWVIGDIHGTPGQDLHICIEGESAGVGYFRTSGNPCDVIDMWRAVYDVKFVRAVHGLECWRAPRKKRACQPKSNAPASAQALPEEPAQ